jgi:hypothetical protein
LIDATWDQAGRWLATNPQRARAEMAAALRQLPDSAVAWYNYGLALHLCGDPQAAIRAYRLSLSFPDPPKPQIANNLAQDLLLSGQFAEGWQMYQHRPPQPLPRACRQWYGPCWQGPGLPPSPLLLVSEQGFGDTLMAVRFVLLLQQQGCQVELVCQQPLVELINHAAPEISCTAPLVRQPLPRTWAPLMGLPGSLGLSAATMPFQQGYLRLQPQLVQGWAQRLQRRPGRLLVALHWQGNPVSEESLYSSGRSLALQVLAELTQLAEVEFVSVQKGHGQEQWPGPFAGRTVAGQAAVDASSSFLDTAAVLANCDLLISADSAVVHLAGALGLPAWVLLKAIPEWRWGMRGDHSYWYRSLRLFRQVTPGAWNEPVRRVAEALAAFSPGRDGAIPMGWAASPSPGLDGFAS